MLLRAEAVKIKISQSAITSGSDAGYTLLELLVVLAIVAMMMASAPTLYGRIVPSFEVRQFAADVATFARRAREKARLSQQVTGFVYSPGTKTLVSIDGNLPFPSGMVVEFVRPVPWGNVGENRVEFYPSGASSGGTFDISRGAASAEVEINWVSGAVKVTQ